MLLARYTNGLTLSRVGRPPKTHGLRGECVGWTEGASRRNRQFLMAVQGDRLDGHGVALTLTTRDCPSSSTELHRRLRAWMDRQRRRGLIRLHWVVEFTRRGVPHVHCAAYYADEWVSAGGWGARAIDDWIEIARESGTHALAQHGREIEDVVGWLVYVAKHTARGIGHYQRQRATLPDGWQRGGRLWGHRGDWPVGEVEKVQVSNALAFRLRRLCRAWLMSYWRRHPGANRRNDGRRVRALRRMLKHGVGGGSGYGSFCAWVPRRVVDELLSAARCTLQVYSTAGSRQGNRSTGSDIVRPGQS